MNNIAYDSRWNGQHGIGRFAIEVSNRLNFSHYLTSKNSPTQLFSEFRLSRWANKCGAKALYSPGYIPPHGSKLPFAFTIHDLNHLDVPYNSSFLKKVYYKSIIRPAIDKAYKILTVSEFSKSRIVEWSNCDERKVHVVGNGVSDFFFAANSPMTPGYQYFFCCSNRRGHKNEVRLLQAFANSKLGKDFKLVLSGDMDKITNDTIKSLNISDLIIFTGKVSEDMLAAWYKGAIATVFPSIYEGFGLPIIESMASGTPVIASNITSLPEVGGDAAYYFDPYELDSISDAMSKIAYDDSLKSKMREKGLEQARKFSWDKTAELVSKALDGII
ncbi:glycosyltransferase family 4 protein [Pseudomonas kulmbachensis]|uniref:Glycosyltransferase family 4 protein n=1 Tax=Pseudomonas kulmbachensis TaxID=3043408 RepID=A0ABW7LSV9_9PSED